MKAIINSYKKLKLKFKKIFFLKEPQMRQYNSQALIYLLPLYLDESIMSILNIIHQKMISNKKRSNGIFNLIN